MHSDIEFSLMKCEKLAPCALEDKDVNAEIGANDEGEAMDDNAVFKDVVFVDVVLEVVVGGGNSRDSSPWIDLKEKKAEKIGIDFY